MLNDKSNKILKKILEGIELPESTYDTAKKRYEDIGVWFQRPDSSCVEYSPNTFSQGSFRLGTVIKPEEGEEYDLDLGCNLTENLTKADLSQKELKKIIGDELELYRKYRAIKKGLDEKKRCWRLEYTDSLSFHMDVVPCIPENETLRAKLKNRMVESTRLDEELADKVSSLAVSITDNQDVGYAVKTEDWRVSNPEGYARWFVSRMKIAQSFLTERASIFNKDSIDDLPYYQWKTPLQSVVQLLKRHRDTMFKDDEDSKPISVIITTLAGHAYNGETDLVSALDNILNNMGKLINNNIPRVPNPVNPEEDFADKWYSPEHASLNLEGNFNRWLMQAKSDFAAICSKENTNAIVQAADRGLAVRLDNSLIEDALGIAVATSASLNRIQSSDPQPWSK